MTDWERDCLEYYGRVLIGDQAHWCLELDYLPLDETCPMWGFCHCMDESPQE